MRVCFGRVAMAAVGRGEGGGGYGVRFGLVLRIPYGAYSHTFSRERPTPTGTRGTNHMFPPPVHPPPSITGYRRGICIQ